jgi:hypothetical protein
MEDILKIVYYTVQNTMTTNCLDDESIVIDSVNFESLSKAKRYMENFVSNKSNKGIKQNIGEIYGKVLDSYSYSDNTHYGFQDYGIELIKVEINIIKGE